MFNTDRQSSLESHFIGIVVGNLLRSGHSGTGTSRVGGGGRGGGGGGGGGGTTSVFVKNVNDKDVYQSNRRMKDRDKKGNKKKRKKERREKRGH